MEHVGGGNLNAALRNGELGPVPCSVRGQCTIGRTAGVSGEATDLFMQSVDTLVVPSVTFVVFLCSPPRCAVIRVAVGQ